MYTFHAFWLKHINYVIQPCINWRSRRRNAISQQ